MFRGLALLFALLAQGITLTLPVSFVRCHRADGQARMELSGTPCGCHDELCHAEEHDGCTDHHDGNSVVHHGASADDYESGDMARETSASLPCSCVHSAVEMAPQVRNRAGHELAAQTVTVFTPVYVPAPAASAVCLRSFLRAAGSPRAAHFAVLSSMNLRV